MSWITWNAEVTKETTTIGKKREKGKRAKTRKDKNPRKFQLTDKNDEKLRKGDYKNVDEHLEKDGSKI